MKTGKLLEYVIARAERLGLEIHEEGTGVCYADGYEHRLCLYNDNTDMEFYYYIQPADNEYRHYVSDTGLIRYELSPKGKVIEHFYTTKKQIDDYFRASGPSLEDYRNKLSEILN